MSSRVERIQNVLNSLSSGNPEILGAALISEDGLVIASRLPAGMDDERVSAVVAALQSIAERAAQQIELGKISRLMVFADRGGALLYVGKKSSLVIFTRPTAKLGLILMEATEAAENLSDVLG